MSNKLSKSEAKHECKRKSRKGTAIFYKFVEFEDVIQIVPNEYIEIDNDNTVCAFPPKQEYTKIRVDLKNGTDAPPLGKIICSNGE